MKSNRLIYVGTYTNGKSKGIYGLYIDLKTGQLEQAELFAKLGNPSYLAVERNSKYLYSVLETEIINGKQSGAVGSLKIDKTTGKLEPINRQTVMGATPCHVCIDNAGEYLLTANYEEGFLTLFPIYSDGSIGLPLSSVYHNGSGPDIERQEGPHTHFVTFTPDEKYICAVDLGIDKIMVYRMDKETGTLIPAIEPSISLKSGSGPRHMEFHPDGSFAYLVNELSSDIIVFKYSPDYPLLSELQHISALPARYTGTNYCAAIHISPDGNFLYVSNRGHDSIAIFRIDKASGRLELIGHTNTYGNFPRDFSIDPAGKFLVVANQNSDNIVSFAIMQDSGKLEQIGCGIEVPSPVCIKFSML